MPESPQTFVVLLHVLPDGSRHWDLGLDQGESLATWQILDDPARLARREVAALPLRRIADHRRAYLDYEGPVSGNRGSVTRVDRGVYHLLARQPHRWRVRMAGCVLSGTFEIVSGDDS